ncbi:FabD/lysophospholipase-like protein [Sarocladium strictum]
MKLPNASKTSLSGIKSAARPPRRVNSVVQYHVRRALWGRAGKPTRQQQRSTLPVAVIFGSLFVWWLYPTDDFAQLSRASSTFERKARASDGSSGNGAKADEGDGSAWSNFARRFGSVSFMTDVEWSAVPDKLVGFIVPEWSKGIPGYINKLQRELSMSSGSLADEIWTEAHDASINPEIRWSADVRVSSELCEEEKEYLARRKKVALVALSKYLDIPEKDIHPDDVPTIAMCGSGGGIRALIAGTGSMLATEEDGLLDCVTYTSGVSGTCWLQALCLTSFTKGSVALLLDHLKARASTHIAYPPAAFQAVTTLPTSKYLLSGLVEKLRGDPKADFGLVDLYGLLLGARYLVPKGELNVDERDFKLSNQREYLKYGQVPLPIYTTIRHEIPGLAASSTDQESEQAKEKAKKEAWFQWYEVTPYEFFCEEFGAGIPTWALGRRFQNGSDVTPESGFHLPELRMPLLMGIFGSAFCATLSHYWREVKPLVKGMSVFGAVDDLIAGRNEDLEKVHPIDPARIPNFCYGMHGKLPQTTPQSIYDSEYIQLMDAGMSNNIPIYPLLRPGRDVDVLLAFDSSADVKTDNWLAVADGYAQQRGIKGWPVGIGWPQDTESAKQVGKELEQAQADNNVDAEKRVQDAKKEQAMARRKAKEQGEEVKTKKDESQYGPGNTEAGDLGYCTVWVGTTQQRSSKPPPPSKAITEDNHWQLMEPEAGITIVYLPFLANEKVPDISPGSTDYLSTWNFIYTPEQVDKIVELAKANYQEGKAQVKATVKAVYERKKKLRLEAEQQLLLERREAALLGDSDQFS